MALLVASSKDRAYKMRVRLRASQGSRHFPGTSFEVPGTSFEFPGKTLFMPGKLEDKQEIEFGAITTT